MPTKEYDSDGSIEPAVRVYHKGVYLNPPAAGVLLPDADRVRVTLDTGTMRLELQPADHPDKGYAVSRQEASGAAIIGCAKPLRDAIGDALPTSYTDVEFDGVAGGGLEIDLSELAAEGGLP